MERLLTSWLFASSFMEQLEKNIEGTYFDALDVEKGNAPLEY